MNQNETKPLTAADVYDQKQRELSPGVKRELRLSKIGIINLMEQYAAQQVKQLTEERDKAVELLRRMIASCDGYPEVLEGCSLELDINNFFHQLNQQNER